MDYETILLEVKSRIDLHKQFKEAYNKQLAIDFNLFNFFKIGENKVSELLVFFINPKSSHGQYDAFIKEFLRILAFNVKDEAISEITCEKGIDNKRRIDLYIRFKSGEILAIENKVWAKDQHNQLKDYSNYLEKKTHSYKLFYLNPYGHSPSEDSITEDERNKLESEKCFQVIKYTSEINDIISAWISVCEADNVSYFLKQFKQYLNNKFLGNNTFNMKENLKDLVYSNIDEVSELVNAYKSIDNETQARFDRVVKELKKEKFNTHGDLKLGENGPFTYEGNKVYKVYVQRENNMIWIHFSKRGLFLFSSHYFEPSTSDDFIKKVESYTFNKDFRLTEEDKDNKTVSFRTHKIVEIFKAQVELAIEAFEKNR
jgi:hypothetical protein